MPILDFKKSQLNIYYTEKKNLVLTQNFFLELKKKKVSFSTVNTRAKKYSLQKVADRGKGLRGVREG